MKALDLVFRAVNTVCKYILIVLFSVMTITYFAQIVLRYAFGTGFTWTEELTRYCMVALIMFGAAVLAGQNGNINVSVLEASVPEHIKKWVGVGQQLITLVFFIVMVKVSVDYVMAAGTQITPNLRIPKAWVYSIFPVAFVVLVFNVIVWILKQFFSPKVKEA
ncbi:MAG: TRAP transporter small permease [Propionibacteriaceae bacterium]|jgi:TRAP-type C4-dicarboxylate transport system permease small subunit|nr:TRAP transporter small permease [Propionibacteriaceae bacterium]